MLAQGDIRFGALESIADESIDSCVTDPPYGLTNIVRDVKKCRDCARALGGADGKLDRCPRCGGELYYQRSQAKGGGFMGKDWDGSGVSFSPDTWAEVSRVLKPGAYLLAFGGTRTFHRMTVAIEDAGFEIRDCLCWLYAVGFPKSRDISKAIDEEAGAERTEVVGTRHRNVKPFDDNNGWNANNTTGSHEYTAPATPEAKQWDGWGTALKPAWEPIILARKPLAAKTVASNVLQYGTGAINVDGCRLGNAGYTSGGKNRSVAFGMNGLTDEKQPRNDGSAGRWPANLLLDEEAGAMLDEQSGERKSGRRDSDKRTKMLRGNIAPDASNGTHYDDSGGASRFFYSAKVSQAERNAGLTENNPHPTVKPISLMRWLVRLVTQPGGIVLDPFMGSGTTGIAAALEQMQFEGRDLNPEYVEIARQRIAHWSQVLQPELL